MQVAARLMPFVPGLAWHAMLRTEPEVRQGLKLMYDGRFRICLMSCLAPIKPPIRGTSQHRLGSGPHQLPQGETAASATSATIVPGNCIQLVPFNQFSWWNKYQFTPVWAASVGLIYFSDSFASSDDSVKLPGFFRVDAGVFAKINETWRAQVNIENVFNKGYWASADGNNNISPGQPRTVRLTAFAKF